MRSRALSPWLQVPVGLLLTLAACFGPLVHADTLGDARLLEAGTVCPAGTAVDAADDCLVPVAGRITDQRGRTSQRWRFQPDDPTLEDQWVRFPGDERSTGSTAQSLLLAGTPATALYATGGVVAFDVDGARVLTTGSERGFGRTVLWGSAWLGSLGLFMLLGVRLRRRDPTTAVGQQRGPAATTSQVLLVVMLGSLGAAFAPSLRAELLTFAIIGGAFAALLVWGRRRTARSAG